MAYRRSTKGVKGVKRVGRRIRKKTTKPAIKQTIQRILANNIETKSVTYTLTSTAFNSDIGANEYYQLIPAISQGTGQTNRIGESIQPQRIVVRGYVNFWANNYERAQEIIARLFCLQDKAVKSWDLKAQMSLNVLDTGGAGSTFTGSLLNVVTPHNNDRFKFFYDKKHHFLKSYGYTNSVGGASTSMTSMNNSLVWFFSFTLDKKDLPAHFKYDGSTYPINFAPAMALGYSYAQNDTPDVVNTQLLMSYSSTLYFKDA